MRGVENLLSVCWSSEFIQPRRQGPEKGTSLISGKRVDGTTISNEN